MAGNIPLDREALHRLLVAVPVHVLCFDSTLRCRYAAPAGGHLLGIPADDLPGKELSAILPCTDDLRAAAQKVLESGGVMQIEHVVFPEDTAGRWQASAWMLRVQPWSLPAVPSTDGGRWAGGDGADRKSTR